MIILASASPRREELLKLITQNFKVVPSNADEQTDLKDARELVRFLACKKARDVAAAFPGDTVIGADTVVEAGGNELHQHTLAVGATCPRSSVVTGNFFFRSM